MKRKMKRFVGVTRNSNKKLLRNGIHKPYGIYEKLFKRPLDVLCALMGILLFWWLYAVIALLVRMNLGSPVLFSQERPGKDEKIFRLYKFRTMTNAKDINGNLLSDAERLTKFGKWLRSTSLDELPELINIMKGDMSFIGPRPLLAEYLPLYSEAQKHRHDVRPGLTGLAQVKGRNSISWNEKFQWDIKYVTHISFWLDVRIMAETVKVVLERKGITSKSSPTMETYQGNN